MSVKKVVILPTLLLTLILGSTLNINAESLDPILTLSFEELDSLNREVLGKDSLSRIKYALGKKYLKKDISYCKELLGKSLRLVEDIKDLDFEIQIKKTKSLAHINLGEIDSALYLLDEATAYYKKQDEYKKYGSCLIFYSYVYSETAEYSKALKFALEALELFSEVGDKRETQSAINRIGIIYRILGDPDNALEHFERIIAMAEKEGITYLYRASLNNASSIYMEKGDLAKAEEYILKTLELRKKENNPKTLGAAYQNLADLEKIRMDKSKAVAYIDSSIVLYKEVNFRTGVANALVEKALLLKDMPKYSEYRDAVIAAHEYMEKWNLKNNEEIVLEAYADILFDEGDQRGAFAALKESQQLAKDKRSYQTNKEIQRLENEVRIKAEQAKVLELSKQVEVKKLQTKYALLLAGAAGALILLLLYSNNLRKKKNREISENLEEKEVLIKEVHHRVKNNLQIVSSMLNLQSRNIDDNYIKRAIVDNRDRVKSMALLHQRLYEGNNLKGVKMKPYIDNLVSSLLHSYHLKEGQIGLDIQVQDLVLDVDTSIPIGLIVNELITNAFKYAFREGSDHELRVVLSEVNQKLILIVSDNGKGFEQEGLEEGFGYQLIRSLSRKLRGELAMKYDNGLEVCMTFHKFKKVSL